MSLSKRYFEQQPTPSERLRNARSRVNFALQTAGESEPTFVTRLTRLRARLSPLTANSQP